jgi:hypothetical protein
MQLVFAARHAVERFGAHPAWVETFSALDRHQRAHHAELAAAPAVAVADVVAGGLSPSPLPLPPRLPAVPTAGVVPALVAVLAALDITQERFAQWEAEQAVRWVVLHT